jgi:hypothetical protein
MVRAILDGRKTQTRRVVSDPYNMIQKIGGSGSADNDPSAFGYFAEGRDFSGWMVLARGVEERVGNNRDRLSITCPYDADRLWVRETFRVTSWDSADAAEPCCEIEYAADHAMRSRRIGARDVDAWCDKEERRIQREGGVLTGDGWELDRERAWRPSIFLERWQSRLTLAVQSIRVERLHDITEEDARAEGVDELGRLTDARGAFVALWESINGERSGCDWRSNPWVWRVEFSRVTP